MYFHMRRTWIGGGQGPNAMFMSPQSSYAEILIPSGMVFGGKAFEGD